MTVKKKYEKPSLVSHVSGLMNKIGKSSILKFQQEIDSVPLAGLMEKYGSPLFVFSEKTLRENYQKYLQAFQLRYPKVTPAWSYKTNYLKSICAVLHSEGALAEVVSEFEYEKARRAGMSGEQIIYNGPYKSADSLKKAMREKALIFIDNFDELNLLTNLSRELTVKPRVGIRINLDSGIFPHWTRFGFNLETGQAYEAIKRITSTKCFEFVGLHCHIGTFILDPNAYRIETEKLMAFASKIKIDFGIKIQVLDLGGGFASKNTLHSQYMSGESANPTFEQYAEPICQQLLSKKEPDTEMPTLILESGRAIVDSAGFLLTSVVGTRRLPDGTRSIVIDAGVNLMYTTTWYKHDILPMADYGDFMESCTVYGPLCMNIDVIRPQMLLPVLKPGNKLIIKNVGAYCVTQWMQFIHMRPAVVLIDCDGRSHVIREKETIDTVEELERLPEHLMNS
ncbi:alanine racemase [Candidatus Riflebacteria bacterium]